MSMAEPQILVALAAYTRDGHFLIDDEGAVKLPGQTFFPGRDVGVVAGSLLKDYLGLRDKEWVTLRQVGFFQPRDSPVAGVILHAVELPERVPLPGSVPSADWENFESLIDRFGHESDTVGLFMRACNYTRG
jgi:hypothetical protein